MLGVTADHPACKVLRLARETDVQTGVAGLISADRIFGLLERDFLDRDIQSAVAQALKPKLDVDLSAHQILLQLATTPSHKVRLVTTNFDRLFTDCDSKIPSLQPPRLPDPSRQDEFDGIIYLHGRANVDYDRSEGDGFVLSSSEFGRAYLSDGWATRFFRDIIEKYVVVFVGYSADDPPVQYLLEALNKSVGQLDGIYAFQSGTSNDAAARWQHKGIQAIAYSDEDAHSLLWRTLEAWAERAKDQKRWRQAVFERAKQGPESLPPHERGQIAHIVSTVEGANDLAEDKKPLGAEWLCVFDPHRRYARPQQSGGLGSDGPYVDPFDCYGLDSDLPPIRIGPDDYHAKRTTPDGAWDCFATNRLDQIDLVDDAASLVRGGSSTNPQALPARLSRIAMWVGNVSNQPAAVWWAGHQFGLHPAVQRNIRWQQDRTPEPSARIISQAWRYLFETWETKNDFSDDFFALKSIVEKDGWDSALARRFARINQPRLKVAFRHAAGAQPPTNGEATTLSSLFALDVDYPDHHEDIAIPDEWLSSAVREMRKNLELAVSLENEIGGWGLHDDSPLIRDNSPDLYGFGGAGGLSGAMRSFVSHFERLMQFDIAAAAREMASWPTDDDSVFSRLRIWTSGKGELVSPQTFDDVFATLSDGAFWSSYHQRDLLMTLAGRWHDLPESACRTVERRLLDGPARWHDEDEKGYDQRRAYATLTRITWLAEKGCTFAATIKAEIDRLQLIVPDWKPEYADKAANSMETHGGWVQTETDHAALLEQPLANVLATALKIGGSRDNFLVDKAPFAGLAASHPVRAFRALVKASKLSEFPLELWRQFLNSDARKTDRPKFMALIAERVSRFPLDAVDGLLRSVSDWLLTVSEQLIAQFPRSFHLLISKLIESLCSQTDQGNSGIGRGDKAPDWGMKALNAPVGKVAQTLWTDLKITALQANDGLPSEWRERADDLLALPGDLRRYALVIFARNLSSFHFIDPNWTEGSLLAVLDSDDEDDRNALWSGFFWGGKTPGMRLYLRLKPKLLAFTSAPHLSRRDHDNVLAGMLLAGWGSRDETHGQRCISNDEMREVLLRAGDDFRSRTLRQLQTWAR
ncbi:MAG: SIR2 family protein [Casimicrobium sp.]